MRADGWAVAIGLVARLEGVESSIVPRARSVSSLRGLSGRVASFWTKRP